MNFALGDRPETVFAMITHYFNAHYVLSSPHSWKNKTNVVVLENGCLAPDMLESNNTYIVQRPALYMESQ